MGSIYRRGNRYWVKYRDPQTRRLIRSSAGRTRAEAALLLAKIEGKAPEKPLCRVLDDYLSHLKVHAKDRSRRVAQTSVKHLTDFFGEREVREVVVWRETA